MPIVHGIIINHLKNNDSDTAETNNFKRILKTSLINRYNVDSHFETVCTVSLLFLIQGAKICRK
jgi:hypothetical protein